jgi:hypothetical protein
VHVILESFLIIALLIFLRGLFHDINGFLLISGPWLSFFPALHWSRRLDYLQEGNIGHLGIGFLERAEEKKKNVQGLKQASC